MPSKNVAVQGCTLTFTNPTISATLAPPTGMSTKVKAASKAVFCDKLSVQVSAITCPPATIPDPGPYTIDIPGTALKAKAEKKALVLLNDKNTVPVVANPQVPGNPPTPSPTPMTLEITNAGQVKVKAA